MTTQSRRPRSSRRSLLLAGGTIGFGFGAIVDVIVFHLIFQTHHLLSGIYDPHTYDGIQTNVMFDGLFLAGMLALLVLGLGVLWRIVNGTDRRFSTRFLLGAVIVGMGLFNVIDGVMSHYVLDLHTVAHGTEVWNPHWLAVSILLLVVGLLILRSADGPRAA